MADKDLLAMLDAIVFLYDLSDAHSFSHIVKTYEAHPEIHGYPVIVVGTKSDLQVVPQKTELTPEEYCKAHGMLGPFFVSSKEDEDFSGVHTQILLAALRPPAAQATRQGSLFTSPAFWTAAAAVGITGAFFWYRHRQSQQ